MKTLVLLVLLCIILPLDAKQRFTQEGVNISLIHSSIYNSTLSYHDKTLGYTIKQIENSLLGVKTWSMWESYIKTLYNNNTENFLSNAFNYWNTGAPQPPALPAPDNGNGTPLD